MTDALFKLLTWLSPSFPIGAFSYSHGLEYAVHTLRITDAASLTCWLDDILCRGSGYADAVLFAAAWAAVTEHDDAALVEIAELGHATWPSAELALETRAQGAAFLTAVLAAWPDARLDRLANLRPKMVYPIAVAAVCALHSIDLSAAVQAYLHGFAANLVSAGVRLIPLGQSDGLRVLAALAPTIQAQAERALTSSLDDLTSSTPFADICSMNHETQYSRLFRS